MRAEPVFASRRESLWPWILVLAGAACAGTISIGAILRTGTASVSLDEACAVLRDPDADDADRARAAARVRHLMHKGIEALQVAARRDTKSGHDSVIALQETRKQIQ